MIISHRFAAQKRDSWESANPLNCWRALPIFERLSPWKRDSCTSANRTSCRMLLLLFELFAHRKYDFWEIATRHICCRYSNFSHPENSISKHQQIDPLAGWHSPYQNCWQFENAIPVYHKIDRYAWQQYSYVNISNPENAIPKTSANQSRFMSSLHISKIFEHWTRKSS